MNNQVVPDFFANNQLVPNISNNQVVPNVNVQVINFTPEEIFFQQIADGLNSNTSSGSVFHLNGNLSNVTQQMSGFRRDIQSLTFENMNETENAQ